MNRLGILVDLSHVGPKTSSDAIKFSKKPVAYTHCCPMLKKHARNKTDEQLREIADADGFVGFAVTRPFCQKGKIQHWMTYIWLWTSLINIVGEEKAGIGTDWVQDQDIHFFNYLPLIKVRADQLLHHIKKCRVCQGLETLGHFGNCSCNGKGWLERTKIRRVLGENWLNFLSQVWE